MMIKPVTDFFVVSLIDGSGLAGAIAPRPGPPAARARGAECGATITGVCFAIEFLVSCLSS